MFLNANSRSRCPFLSFNIAVGGSDNNHKKKEKKKKKKRREVSRTCLNGRENIYYVFVCVSDLIKKSLWISKVRAYDD